MLECLQWRDASRASQPAATVSELSFGAAGSRYSLAACSVALSENRLLPAKKAQAMRLLRPRF